MLRSNRTNVTFGVGGDQIELADDVISVRGSGAGRHKSAEPNESAQAHGSHNILYV